MQTISGPDGAQRIPPQLPAHAVKTFGIATPGRPASCEEYGCRNYLNGWQTIVGPDQAELVRSLHGRYSFTETRDDSGLYVFTFPAGQPCFVSDQHRMPWDGRERFVERGGDWRGNPRGDRREYAPGDWVDAFANHQIRLADRLGRG